MIRNRIVQCNPLVAVTVTGEIGFKLSAAA